jgi:hypothetical protein
MKVDTKTDYIDYYLKAAKHFTGIQQAVLNNNYDAALEHATLAITELRLAQAQLKVMQTNQGKA